MQFRWYGKILPDTLTDVQIVVLSDLHYGNPYCSVKHFGRTIDYIKENENCYCLLNGDLCESAIRTSKGDIYRQVGSPDDQKQQIVEWLLPVKDKVLGMTCLTDDTLVLTDRGWQTCYNLSLHDRVYSVNTETGDAEYAAISEINIKPWQGQIYHLGGTRQKQKLTPDHWVFYWNDYKRQYDYRQVSDLPQDMHHICIPIARRFSQGESTLTDDEVRFLAWVITEGHISYKKAKLPVIEISQSETGHVDILASLFARLSLSPSVHRHKGRANRTKEADWACFYFPHQQVKKYIDILGGKKEIPRQLLNLPPRQLDILYETMMMGDGCRRTYYTANINLAHQMLELILKRGKGGRLATRVRTQTYQGYATSVRTVGYTVNEYRYSNAYPCEIEGDYHEGFVFCLKTTNGNFMAMREGCPFVTGNTGNHEARIADVAGTDISAYIAERLEVPYRAEGMLYKLSFGDGSNHTKGRPYVFWLYMTHGYGGARTRGAKAVKVERLSHWQLADVFCMSHDHEVNVAPLVRFVADPRGTEQGSFISGAVTEKRIMLIKSNAYVKFGGYAESGGFAPSDLSTPIINLLSPASPKWGMCPDRPAQGVKVWV